MTTIPPDLLAHPASAGKTRTLTVASWLGLLLLLLLLGGGALRLLTNSQDALALEQRTADSLLRSVNVTHAKAGKLKNNVELPGSLYGYKEAVIYARSNGYLSAWYKTLGDKVNKGDLLAIIEAPEQTQELMQAKATREQVNARLGLAKLTQERWETLRQHDSVPQQELEEKRSAYNEAVADLAVIDATIGRLQQLESFRRIVAPFSGVITRRSVDVGELVVPGSKELFALAQTDVLRLSVWVPQVYASEVKPGQEVSVSVGEVSAKLSGKVAHISGSIDPVTRSRQVEVTIDNPGGKLIPGAYAEARLDLVRGLPVLIASPSVLVVGKNDPYVVVVNKEDKIEYRTIKLGRDLGKSIEILDGITAEDALVISPSELLEQGDQVIAKLRVDKEDDDKNKEKNSAGKEKNSVSSEKTKSSAVKTSRAGASFTDKATASSPKRLPQQAGSPS